MASTRIRIRNDTPGRLHARELDLAAQELEEIHRGRRPGHREPHLHSLVVETKHEVPHRRAPGNEAMGSPGPELDGTVVGGDDAVEEMKAQEDVREVERRAISARLKYLRTRGDVRRVAR
jgi:hypothetical protein